VGIAISKKENSTSEVIVLISNKDTLEMQALILSSTLNVYISGYKIQYQGE
jgi:hypothetical protein